MMVKKRGVHITPAFTEDERELVCRALYVLAGRNYALTDQESIFDGVYLGGKCFGELKVEADACVVLQNRLEKLYREKIELKKKQSHSLSEVVK